MVSIKERVNLPTKTRVISMKANGRVERNMAKVNKNQKIVFILALLLETSEMEKEP